MGNKASSSSSSAFFAHKDFVLGDAHLDSSSPHVVHPNCVSNRELQLVHHRGNNNKWYVLKKKEEEEEENNSRSETTKDFLFAMESPKQQGVFSGSSTQVIVDSKGTVLALLQKTSKGRKIQTLIYRPIPTFDGQSPAMEIYKESVLKKYEAADSTTTRNKALPPLPKYYLFARQLCNPAANPSSKTTFGDSSYALLQVDVVYNDPDFAKFKEPPLYRAVTVRGGGGSGSTTTGITAIIMDGSTNTVASSMAPMTDGGTTSPTTILGTVTKTHATISNGVDLIAVLTLGSSALMSPPTMVGGTLASPRGAAVVDRSGVV